MAYRLSEKSFACHRSKSLKVKNINRAIRLISHGVCSIANFKTYNFHEIVFAIETESMKISYEYW